MMKRTGSFTNNGCWWMVGVFAIMTLFGTSTTLVEAKTQSMELLMIGNSFSEVHNMEEMLQAMLNERKMVLQANSVFAARFEEQGAKLALLVDSEAMTRTIGERQWTWVILQEQSQTPGFYDISTAGDDYKVSLDAVLQLNREIQAVGGTTILFETWGYFDKDPMNPGIFSDFSVMQDKITTGYEGYRKAILKANPHAQVKIAPAGLAFQRVYNHIKEDGKDPLEKGSLFEKLYDEVDKKGDPRKYPSLIGAYMCGCVLFQTLTGLDVRQSSYSPPGLDPKIRRLVQTVAYDTVTEYNGGSANMAPNKYALPSDTVAPYVPSDGGYSSSSGGSSGGGGGRWMFKFVIVGAMGMVAWTKRDDIRDKVSSLRGERPYQYQQQPYDFQPLSGGANMELSDFPGAGGPSHQPML